MCWKWVFASIFLLGLLSSGCFLGRKGEQLNPPVPVGVRSFFVPVPIAFSSIRSPYLDVVVDNETFSVAFDLGFRGDLSISSALIDRIASKTFLRSKSMYGFRGQEHHTRLYRIPGVRIGRIFFEQPTLQERSSEARDEGVVLQDPLAEVFHERNGLIGWELFCKTKLLIDTRNAKIAICDSLETLGKQGYPIERFVKTSLLIDRGLVEFEASTANGPLRCVLDTGSSWNILNTEIEEGKAMEEVMWEPSNVLEYPSFAVQDVEFGPIEFHRIPIKIPIPVQAMLGMEFFDRHLIFIDFPEKQLYFLTLQEAQGGTLPQSTRE